MRPLMKNKTKLFTLTLASVLAGALPASAAYEANYFRAWQGFKKSSLSDETFMRELPDFMKKTVDLYQNRALNNYIVAIPPLEKPAYIPDEIALVALSSEEDYQSIRNTPEGKKYSARHWDIFDKNTSHSAKHLIDYNQERPDKLDSNWAYDMIGQPIDWSDGVNYVFIGVKKPNGSKGSFLERLKSHIEIARETMEPKGLRGYIVIANENYEIAFLNWESQISHDNAGVSKKGKVVFDDANEFMDVLMYESAAGFTAGKSITYGKAYSTLQKGE